MDLHILGRLICRTSTLRESRHILIRLPAKTAIHFLNEENCFHGLTLRMLSSPLRLRAWRGRSAPGKKHRSVVPGLHVSFLSSHRISFGLREDNLSSRKQTTTFNRTSTAQTGASKLQLSTNQEAQRARVSVLSKGDENDEMEHAITHLSAPTLRGGSRISMIDINTSWNS